MSTLTTEYSIEYLKSRKDFSSFRIKTFKFFYFESTKRNARNNTLSFVSIDFEPTSTLFLKLPSRDIVYFVDLIKNINPEYIVKLGRTGYINDDFIHDLFTVELLISKK